MADLYDTLKGKAYGAACAATGCDDKEAIRIGFRDVFDLIMSDSLHHRQEAFVHHLATLLKEDERTVLLDGMSKQYVRTTDWRTYIERERSPHGR